MSNIGVSVHPRFVAQPAQAATRALGGFSGPIPRVGANGSLRHSTGSRRRRSSLGILIGLAVAVSIGVMAHGLPSFF